MKVRIYQEQEPATQSGKSKKRWALEQTLCSDTHTESLMGWSANGSHSKHTLYFNSLSECKTYANEKNFDYEVMESFVQQSPPKSYSDNFK